MIEIRETFPSNSGLYIRYMCGRIQIFSLIEGCSKTISVIKGNSIAYHNLSFRKILFGFNLNLYPSIIKTVVYSKDYGSAIVKQYAPSVVEAYICGLPHSSINRLCLGRKYTNTLKAAYNYYWRSNFVVEEFGMQFLFKNGNIETVTNSLAANTVKFEFLKQGNKVFITNNKNYKNKALIILNMSFPESNISDLSEFYIL